MRNHLGFQKCIALNKTDQTVSNDNVSISETPKIYFALYKQPEFYSPYILK